MLAFVGIDETLAVFTTPIFAARGFSESQIGILLAAFFAGAIISVLPAGFISDRVKAKNIISGGVFGLMISLLGLYFFNNFWLNLILIFLSGIASRFAMIATEVLYYKFLAKSKRKKLAYLNVYKGLAHGIFTIGAGFLAVIFFLDSIFLVVCAILFFLLIASFFVPSQAVFSIQISSYKKELNNSKVFIFLVLVFLFFFHGGADNLSLPYIWVEELNFSYSQVGLLYGLAVIIPSLTLQPWIASHAANTKLIRVYAILGLVMSASGHFIMSQVSSFNIMFVGRTLHLFGDVLFFFFLVTELAWLYSKKTIGGQFGLYTLVAMSSGMVSRVFMGYWGEFFSFRSSLYISASVMLLAALVVLVFKIDFSKRD